MMKRGSRATAQWLLLLAPLAAGSSARATDGVVELSASCALSTGCLPGDAAGYPITIGDPGSFRLTSNLEVTGNTTAIWVTHSDVTIDLAGFRIHGPNSCSGIPLTCSMSGSGSGVAVSSTTTIERVSVMGGTVAGMPDAGIRLGPASVARFLRLASNGVGISIAQGVVESSIVALSGTTGVFATGSATVEDAIAANNAGDGFALGSSSVITGSLATANGEDGFQAGANSRVVDCAGTLNGLDGIDVAGGSTVSGSAARGNGSAGIRVGAGSLIRDSVAFFNDAGGFVTGQGANLTANTATRNAVAGITTGARSFVIGSNSSDNTGAGMLLGDDSSYRESLIASNDGGTVLINGAGAFNAAGGNHCTDAAGTVVACP